MATNHRAPSRSPDLTAFTLVHRAIRRDAARLASAVTGLGDGDVARARALRRWYGHYRAEVDAHHELEDELYFPVLAERVPIFDEHADRIAREHHLLDDALSAVDDRLDVLAGDGASARSARGPAREATCELTEVLDVHLAFEDADIVPLFLRHFTADEFAEVEVRTRAKLDRKELPFLVPWLMSAATPPERDRMLATAPTALKLVWFASRRRHDRLATRALGRPAQGVA